MKEEKKPAAKGKDETINNLPGVGAATAEKLESSGFTTVMAIAVATPGELTDAAGVTEATAESRGELGVEHLSAALQACRSEPLEQSVASVRRLVEQWCEDSEPADDVTVLADVLPVIRHHAEDRLVQESSRGQVFGKITGLPSVFAKSVVFGNISVLLIIHRVSQTHCSRDETARFIRVLTRQTTKAI